MRIPLILLLLLNSGLASAGNLKGHDPRSEPPGAFFVNGPIKGHPVPRGHKDWHGKYYGGCRDGICYNWDPLPPKHRLRLKLQGN